jgi:hypothetical protein
MDYLPLDERCFIRFLKSVPHYLCIYMYTQTYILACLRKLYHKITETGEQATKLFTYGRVTIKISAQSISCNIDLYKTNQHQQIRHTKYSCCKQVGKKTRNINFTFVPSSKYPSSSIKASNPEAKSLRRASLCAAFWLEALALQNSVFVFWNFKKISFV